jgi:hypothetical protein
MTQHRSGSLVDQYRAARAESRREWQALEDSFVRDIPRAESLPEWRRRANEQVERYGFVAVADLTGKGF